MQTLTGSEKQIAWAEKIRVEILTRLDERILDHEKAVNTLKTCKDAEEDLELAEESLNAYSKLKEAILLVKESKFFCDNNRWNLMVLADLLKTPRID